MSTMEEDTEFRDLIIKKLENNGVLLKMKVSEVLFLHTHRPIATISVTLLGCYPRPDLQSS